MLEDLANKLYDKGKLKKLFLTQEFNFSFHGFSFSINAKNPITNVSALLEIMFKYLKNKKIKVLILIDDIACNDNVKAFIYSYQSLLRDSCDIFLLITGLFENISEDAALILAKLTNGYAYAYQLLGNLLFKYNTYEVTPKIIQDYDLALEDNVYQRFGLIYLIRTKIYVMQYLNQLI